MNAKEIVYEQLGKPCTPEEWQEVWTWHKAVLNRMHERISKASDKDAMLAEIRAEIEEEGY